MSNGKNSPALENGRRDKALFS